MTTRRAAGEGTIYRNSKPNGPGSEWIGENKRYAVKVYGRTKKAARDKLNERVAAAKNPTFDSEMTVAELLDVWINAGCPNVKRKSRPSESTQYRHWWASQKLKEVRVRRQSLGSFTLAALRASDIESALRTLASTPSASKGKKTEPLGAESLKKVRDTLRMALTFAQREQWVASNVATLAMLPEPKAGEEERENKGALSLKDSKRAAALFRDEGEVLFYLMLRLGLRGGEAAGIAVEDVVFDHRDGAHVRIWRSAKRDYKHRKDFGASRPQVTMKVVERLKTERSRRSLLLPPDVVDILREHLDAEAERIKQERRNGETPLLFVNSAGGVLDPAKSRKRLAALCAREGLFVVGQNGKPLRDRDGKPRPPRPHELRHTWTTRQVEKDQASPVEIADAGGWGSTRLLFSTYRHLDERRPRGVSGDDWMTSD